MTATLETRRLFTSFAVLGLALFAATLTSTPASSAESQTRVFELRTYTTFDGKLDDLNARFRVHSIGLLRKHGADVIGFWIPRDQSEANTLVYLVAFPSVEARDKTWHELFSDPVWEQVKANSERNGKIVKRVVSQILAPTDYSPIE